MFRRDKLKHRKQITLSHFYDFYLRTYKHDLDKNTYDAISKEWFKKLADDLIENGRVLLLPYRLGHLFVCKSNKWMKKDKFSGYWKLDYVATKKYGKPIFLLNEHTNGYRYRCHWSKTEAKVKNVKKYQFILNRTYKRRLCRLIVDEGKDYIEIDYGLQIH